MVLSPPYTVRHVTTSTLQSLGFRVMEAQNGEDALEMLEADPTATLVFTDINMPGRVSGIDLGTIVRQRWPQIGVLLTSGYVGEEADLSGFEILLKPFRAADLTTKLLAMLPGIAERPHTS